MNKKLILIIASVLIVTVAGAVFYLVVLPKLSASAEADLAIDNDGGEFEDWGADSLEYTGETELDGIEPGSDSNMMLDASFGMGDVTKSTNTVDDWFITEDTTTNADTSSDYNISYDQLTEEQRASIMSGDLKLEDLIATNAGGNIQTASVDTSGSDGSGFDALFTSMLEDDSMLNWDDAFSDVDWGTEDVNTGTESAPADLLEGSEDGIGTTIGPDGQISDDETCPPEDENQDDSTDGMGGLEDDAGLLSEVTGTENENEDLPAVAAPAAATENDDLPVVTIKAAQTGDIFNTIPIGAAFFLFSALAAIGYCARRTHRKGNSRE